LLVEKYFAKYTQKILFFGAKEKAQKIKRKRNILKNIKIKIVLKKIYY
jgi:hypothetical protein